MPDAPRNTWHEPTGQYAGKVAHYHDKHGLPICGLGWFPGKATDKPRKTCKGCQKRMGG